MFSTSIAILGRSLVLRCHCWASEGPTHKEKDLLQDSSSCEDRLMQDLEEAVGKLGKEPEQREALDAAWLRCGKRSPCEWAQLTCRVWTTGVQQLQGLYPVIPCICNLVAPERYWCNTARVGLCNLQKQQFRSHAPQNNPPPGSCRTLYNMVPVCAAFHAEWRMLSKDCAIWKLSQTSTYWGTNRAGYLNALLHGGFLIWFGDPADSTSL